MFLRDEPPYVSINTGVLTISSFTLQPPFDACVAFEIQHHALPDNSLQSKTVVVKVMKDQYTPAQETCSPLEGRCSPRTDQFPLTTTADETKNIILYQQDSMNSYKRECAVSLFALRGSPVWVIIDIQT